MFTLSLRVFFHCPRRIKFIYLWWYLIVYLVLAFSMPGTRAFGWVNEWRNWALFHFESLVWINFYPGAVRRSNSNFNEGVSFQPTANSRDGIDSSGFWNLYLMFDSLERPVGGNWLLKPSLTPNFARKESQVPLMMCVRTVSWLFFLCFQKVMMCGGI